MADSAIQSVTGDTYVHATADAVSQYVMSRSYK